MKILKNEKLDKYTTVKIGGVAECMFVPESIEDLQDVIRLRNPQYFLGGGSNLLISDERAFDCVVNLREFDKTIDKIGDGIYRIGASVRLQKLITTINENGYGGIESLYSVPGLVGGAVAMNAGGGKEQGYSISDYIISVDCIKNGCLVTLKKEECDFSYRNSIFKKNPSIIVCSVLFCFPQQDEDVSKRKRKERLDFCKKVHDMSCPNFGSVFREFNPRIIHYLRLLERNHKSGVHLSSVTDNWICNKGKGSFSQAIKVINKVIRIHKLFRKKCVPEVIIWR